MAKSPTILLIDYDPGSVRNTREPLENAGYTVEVANDGEEGLLAFERIKPDLVLIEPMVPKKHGFQVCQEIKSTTDGKKTPVLITTAFYRGRKHRSEARQNYGCDDYLEKPIPEELLLSTCRKYLIDIQAPEAERSDAGQPEPVVSRDSQLPSLDDLSDDEIQARLDALIDEEIGLPTLVESPAHDLEPVAPGTGPAPVARVPPAAPPTESVRPTDAAVLPAAPAELPEAATAAMVALPGPALPDRASRWPLWIAVAAVVCVASGAAILWALQGRAEPIAASTETAIPTLPAADPRPPSRPVPERPVEPEAPNNGAGVEPAPAGELGSRPSSAGGALAGLAVPEATPPAAGAAPGDLFALEDVDRPPVAANTPAPAYPQDARDAAPAQPIVLRLLVDETGRVTQIEIDAAGSDALLLQSAVETARGWTYEPAIKDGVPVKVWMTETFVVEAPPTGRAS